MDEIPSLPTVSSLMDNIPMGELSNEFAKTRTIETIETSTEQWTGQKGNLASSGEAYLNLSQSMVWSWRKTFPMKVLEKSYSRKHK